MSRHILPASFNRHRINLTKKPRKAAFLMVQVKLDTAKDPFHLFLKTDAFYYHVSEEPKLEIREGYLDFTSSKWDARLGRQVITWGVGDYFLNPEIKYNFSDHVWAAIGANVFGGGEKWSQFGQLDRNDNIYLQLRYEF